MPTPLRDKVVRLASSLRAKDPLRLKLEAVLNTMAGAPFKKSRPHYPKLEDERVAMDMFDAGYEAASYFNSRNDVVHLTRAGTLDVDNLWLWAIKHDRRMPRGLNESHPEFWSRYEEFIAGVESYVEGEPEMIAGHGR